CLLLLASISAPAVSLFADTIYQANAQGKQVVIQRDAIVVKEDPSFLVYKHFDLKEQRVVKVVLNKGSLPYEVNTSAPEARRQISNAHQQACGGPRPRHHRALRPGERRCLRLFPAPGAAEGNPVSRAVTSGE